MTGARTWLNSFVAATETEVWPSTAENLPDLLKSRHLYKSLSLLLAGIAGIKVPPSLLLLASRLDLLAEFAHQWGKPLMVRVDFQRRTKAKPIGGIPLYELDTMLRVSEDLLKRGYMPLFHRHLDRFADLFSVGILLSKDSDVVEIEVVGKGFDAADLRLGKATPHETFRVNLTTGQTERMTIISEETYQRERSARASFAQKLQLYSGFANRSAKLLSDLNELPSEPRSFETGFKVPGSYEKMPKKLLLQLVEITKTVKLSLLSVLPPSTTYVASLSYMAQEGWILWDIYGEWYWR